MSKRSYWDIIDDCEHFIAKCSNCGNIEDSRLLPNKCPKCSAIMKNSEGNSLKPCPFCGSKVELRVATCFDDKDGNCHEIIPTPQIECSCGFIFWLKDPNWNSLDEFKAETIKVWNRRVDDGTTLA